MSVIHVAVHEGPPYWRIEASPKKQMDKMVKEATRALKKSGVENPEWKIRKIGGNAKLSEKFAEVQEHLDSAKAGAERIRNIDVQQTPAQKRKTNR